MFAQNQKKVYQQKDGVRNINNGNPNAKESKQFWSKIWDNEKEHETNVKEIKSRKWQQTDINITTDMIPNKSKRSQVGKAQDQVEFRVTGWRN